MFESIKANAGVRSMGPEDLNGELISKTVCGTDRERLDGAD